MSIFTLIKNTLFNKYIFTKENSINIKILDDGFLDIDFIIKDNNKKTSINLANVLYKMNSGKLYDDTVSAMIEHSKNNPVDSEFMLNTIYNWGLLVKQKNNDVSTNDDPVIRPSKVFISNK